MTHNHSDMKTIKYTLIGTFLLISTVLCAQRNPVCPNVDEMHAQKWQYMVEQAKLSPQEIASVQPIFMQYEKSAWRLHDSNRTSFKKALQVKGNEKPNYTEMNDRYVNQEIKKAMMLKSYHQKLRRLLAPETLFYYYKAERSFKRKLLHDMKDHRMGGNRP